MIDGAPESWIGSLLQLNHTDKEAKKKKKVTTKEKQKQKEQSDRESGQKSKTKENDRRKKQQSKNVQCESCPSSYMNQCLHGRLPVKTT